MGCAVGVGWVFASWTGWDYVPTIAGSCIIIGISLFSLLMNIGNRLEIRRFCRKHGFKILCVRSYKNHYGVDLIVDGEKKYWRWPKDFEEFEGKP
jgi:hypothetical protein